MSKPARVVAPIRVNFGQIQLDGPGAGSLSDHEIQLKIFHGRIEDFFHHMIEPMDLINKQAILGMQIGQQGRQVPRPFDHRTGGAFQIDLQLLGNNIGQGGLAQSGKSVEEHMIQGLSPFQGRLDKNP